MKLTALASLVFCGLGVLAWPDQALAETAARARRPVTHEVLARVDASVAPAGFALLTHSRTAGNYEAGGMALGPRLGVNVGYGVSRLVRLGFGAGADFALDLATTQNIPFTDIDGWMRWFAGPTVGFRWGPRVPLELEVHLALRSPFPVRGARGRELRLGVFGELAPEREFAHRPAPVRGERRALRSPAARRIRRTRPREAAPRRELLLPRAPERSSGPHRR